MKGRRRNAFKYLPTLLAHLAQRSWRSSTILSNVPSNFDISSVDKKFSIISTDATPIAWSNRGNKDKLKNFIVSAFKVPFTLLSRCFRDQQIQKIMTPSMMIKTASAHHKFGVDPERKDLEYDKYEKGYEVIKEGSSWVRHVRESLPSHTIFISDFLRIGPNIVAPSLQLSRLNFDNMN